MKLYLNKASPYARLVQVVAHEKGLTNKIELVWTDPWKAPPAFLGINPYSKVPALVTDDGQAIVESGCICEYLDHVGAGRKLLLNNSSDCLATLRKYGLGRGLIDVAFGVVIERRFLGPNTKSELAERWLAAVPRALNVLETEKTLARAGELPDLGDLTIAVGLSYMEFRLPEIRWRPTSPQLTTWFDRLAARPSMRLSAPE